MVYADLFFQTKTALQRAIQEEEDQRKLLEEALQLQIADMMDAIKVEIDRNNRERERSEEARREKFQRDALKIRETLDDDRSKKARQGVGGAQLLLHPHTACGFFPTLLRYDCDVLLRRSPNY